MHRNLSESRRKYERLLATCQSLSEAVSSRGPKLLDTNGGTGDKLGRCSLGLCSSCMSDKAGVSVFMLSDESRESDFPSFPYPTSPNGTNSGLWNFYHSLHACKINSDSSVQLLKVFSLQQANVLTSSNLSRGVEDRSKV